MVIGFSSWILEKFFIIFLENMTNDAIPSRILNLKNSFAEIKAGNEVDKVVLTELYKQFAEATVRHFMSDFNKTLDLGMIKRKAADIGSAAVIKAVHIAANKIIPNLTKDELLALAEYHDTLFHA